MTELHFKGKEFVYNHHLSVPFHPLVPHADKGIGEVAFDGNLIVQGDNLKALKALMPIYAGRVDCIFIDPPYNTGNEGWAYNDNVNAPMIKEWLAANPIGIDDGLRHDKWCAMMWPRLRLLHELLAEDGILFACIDDIEEGRLRAMCLEIFGETGFVTTFIWKSRVSEDTRAKNGVSNDHEYILCFSKSEAARLQGTEKDQSKFSNSDDDPRGPWRSADLTGLATEDQRPNLHYDVINPATNANYGCPPKGWRYDPSTMARKIEEGRILWPDSLQGRPRHKLFSDEMKSQFKGTSSVLNGFNTAMGTREVAEILGSGSFDFPKPSELVTFLISQIMNENAVVLDSFAGSGTTAHAVLQANKRDGGNRRFILVEMEDYADRLTAERVRRVINGYDFTGTRKTELLRKKLNWTALKNARKLTDEVEKIENLHGHEFDRISKSVKNGELIVTGEVKVEERTEGLGGSFTYCTLGDPVEMDRILTGENLPAYDQLGALLFHMASNRPLDMAGIDQSANYLGQSADRHVWLIYRDDLDWLKSQEAALTLSFARQIAADKTDKPHLVFAPARFVSQKYPS